jgi:O-antigen/teichoic acid export membrane protein
MTAQTASVSIVSRRALLGSSILVVESTLRLGMVAAGSLWIAHQLGPARFGLLNHVSALVYVFLWAAMLGLETPLTARLANSAQSGLLLGSAIVLRVATGVLGALLVVVAAVLLHGAETETVLLTAIVALSVPLSAPLVIDTWFKARGDALAPALARLAATLLSCVAKVACLLFGGSLVALAWTVALEALMVSAALLLAYGWGSTGVAGAPLTVRRSQVMALLRECGPFLMAALAAGAYLKVDVVMLGVLASDEQTGLYSLSQKLCEVLYLVPVIVVDVLFPALVRHQALHGNGAAPQVFFDLTFAAAPIATLLAIVFVVAALPALFGEPYRPTAGIFVLHAWACLGIALNHARFKWMAATGCQALAPWVALLGVLLALLLHALLIPSHGATGAAVGTVLAYALSGWLVSYLVPGLRPVATMQTRALWPWGRLWGEWCRGRAAGAVAGDGRL